jgi:hypothetical protein
VTGQYQRSADHLDKPSRSSRITSRTRRLPAGCRAALSPVTGWVRNRAGSLAAEPGRFSCFPCSALQSAEWYRPQIECNGNSTGDPPS